jgi:organic hydroperoxide reductase OsmC/OhrA
MHTYNARIVWDGNLGDGTSSYAGYGRQYRTMIEGKPDLAGSADPSFRGEREKHNPEDLFLASISACHMLTYLALCAREGTVVIAYEDAASGTMSNERFEEVILRPHVTITEAARADDATKLHERAHALCFIANSCSVPIHIQPVIEVAP